MLHTSTVAAAQPDRSRPRLVFLHGLFGQGRNWGGIAKSLAAQGFESLLIDLPNHGRSDWTAHFDYHETAQLVAEAIGPTESVIVGHSLGGKVAMRLALSHPHLVQRLVVVDIAPVGYTRISGFSEYVTAMRGIDLAELPDRATAETLLTPAVAEATVRSFLLQNLRRNSAPDRPGWHWQANLGLFAAELSHVGAEISLAPGEEPFPHPVLWIAGGQSDYVQPESHAPMRALFPHARLMTIKEAGHWVHSDQPEIFVSAIARFASAESVLPD